MELAVVRKTFRATGKDITRVMVKAIKAMVKATAKAGEVVERARSMSTRDLRACGDHGEARRLQRLPRRLPIIVNASLSSSMLNCVKNLSVLYALTDTCFVAEGCPLFFAWRCSCV